MGRYIVGALVAIIVVAGLFFLMRYMVAQERFVELPEPRDIIVVTPKKEPPINDDSDLPDSASEPPPPPEFEPPVRSERSGEAGERITPDYQPPIINPRGSQSAVPLVRIEPEYPPELVGRVSEPVAVTVAYDLDEFGNVQNARVIAIDPPDADKAFAREAIRAVERFRYRPGTDENGKAVPIMNLQLVIRFDPLPA